MDAVILSRDDFPQFIEALKKEGYDVVGPTVKDAAIVYDQIASVDDLPIGWTDEQDGGAYRLKRRDDMALFGYNVGPYSWKKYLFPPHRKLWSSQQAGPNVTFTEEAVAPAAKYAFFGVRSCELEAIAVQDKVFIEGDYVDPYYRLRRDDLLLIAVQCAVAGNTCFCHSMGTGPRAEQGFDLALSERLTADRHYFVVEIASERGRAIMENVAHRSAEPVELSGAKAQSEQVAQQMGRQMDTADIKELLYGNYEHPRWDDVASRCLACANCTLVCPTCFCSTVEDVTDLNGEHAERWQSWDSCFTMDFSYIHGGSIRPTIRSRYRQWMTHKLATWIDQFGTSGCVGCGRCITWCPVAIDITEEVKAIREGTSDGQKT